jgi:hypothetical protein
MYSKINTLTEFMPLPAGAALARVVPRWQYRRRTFHHFEAETHAETAESSSGCARGAASELPLA